MLLLSDSLRLLRFRGGAIVSTGWDWTIRVLATSQIFILLILIVLIIVVSWYLMLCRRLVIMGLSPSHREMVSIIT